MIRNVLDDRVISKFTSFVLTGGEFILHPRYKDILSLLEERKKRYILLSNGILADRIIDTVKEFNVKHVSISLDGTPETNQNVRGVDNYSSIVRIIDTLREDNMAVNIGYTVSPWNTRKDLEYVMQFCTDHGASLTAGYYCNVEYYDAKGQMPELYSADDLLSDRYHALHSLWASDCLNMPCLSIALKPVIRPNGDVELCEPKQIKLGNLYQETLSKIWNGKKARSLQRQYKNCNACWYDSQRQCDIDAIATMRRFIPASLLDRIFGKYDWNKIC